MKTTLKTIAALLLLTSAAACNTIQGAGEDISSLGKATAEAAENVQENIQDDEE